ncbi:MAG TPA: glycosyltransferase family 39 protein [Thermoanaerobaculia bacterium]
MQPLSWGEAGAGIAAIVLFAGVFFRQARLRRKTTLILLTLGVLFTAARLVLALRTPAAGWTGRYYVNETWSGQPEWPVRVDREIDFAGETFPLHYLNTYGERYRAEGENRGNALPLSVDWTGYIYLESGRVVPIELAARGIATLDIDGRRVREPRVPLSAGSHALRVRYTKPPATEGAIRLSLPYVVTPEPSARPYPVWLRTAARVVDGALLILGACVLFALTRAIWPLTRAQKIVAALYLGIGLQGWLIARRMYGGKAVALTQWDDWFSYEASAREVLQHGPLMTFGAPLGAGEPYVWHPLYCYFLAGMHVLTGEGLFGPVFAQYLIVAIVAILLFRFLAARFGEPAAIGGIVAFLCVFQMAFIRNYTYRLLTENLYILPLTLLLICFVRWAERGAWRDLVAAGFLGGVSSITRPATMLYLIPALVLVLIIAFRRRRPVVASVLVMGLFWMLGIAPVTLRNRVVSGRWVLISDVPSRLSDLARDLTPGIPVQGTTQLALRSIGDAIAREPARVARHELKKLGYTAGLTHLAGFPFHPELLGVTLLYLAMLVASPRLRELRFWPMHLFVLTHAVLMLITIPWNYGYRLLLPAYVFTSTLGATALVAKVSFRMRPNA